MRGRKGNTEEYRGKPSSSRPFGPFKAAWLLLLTIYSEERHYSTGEGSFSPTTPSKEEEEEKEKEEKV